MPSGAPMSDRQPLISITTAFAAPTAIRQISVNRPKTCVRIMPRSMATPERPKTLPMQLNSSKSAVPDQSSRTTNQTLLTSTAAKGAPDSIEDGPYALACIWLLRSALRSRTGLTSARDGYPGLVDECRMLLARSSPQEQRQVVEGLLRAAVIPPVGVAMFRALFANNPAFNADLTPLCFWWLVGESERNKPDEGGEGVYIKKCRFLEEAACKGLCVNMCQQPVQNLFTDTLGLPLRMTPNYEDNSCQMTFGVAPLPTEEDPAASGECLQHCKMSQAYRKTYSNAPCYDSK